MVNAVIANQTHVVVGEENQSADTNFQSADHTSQSADSSGQPAGISDPPAKESSAEGSTPLTGPSQSEPQREGGGWSPLLVKSTLIASDNRFSSRQLDRGSDWTPAGRPSSARRH